MIDQLHATGTEGAPLSDDPPVVVGRKGAVVTLRLNRPTALNAVNVSMAIAILAAAESIAADDTVRAVLLSGAGRGFMAGGDLEVLQANPIQGAADLIEPLHKAVAILARIDAPIVAQVHGVVAGAGLSLMLLADFVVAAETTKFNFAYANIGASCDCGGSWHLPRLVGLRRALELSLLSETISAEDARGLGMINYAVPAINLDAKAMVLAQKLAEGPTRALGHIRRLMRRSFDQDLDKQLADEAAAFALAASTEDFRAGVDAFLSKRKTTFIGA